MELDIPLQCTQEPANGPYPEPAESGPQLHPPLTSAQHGIGSYQYADKKNFEYIE
jgi:hypothetical protein